MLRVTMIAMVFMVVGLVAGVAITEAFPVPGPAQMRVKVERNFVIRFKNTPKDFDINNARLECEVKK
jgi:hypothetical protein